MTRSMWSRQYAMPSRRWDKARRCEPRTGPRWKACSCGWPAQNSQLRVKTWQATRTSSHAAAAHAA
eukprot:3886565-Lingulodinium_polyedra.AAC.1